MVWYVCSNPMNHCKIPHTTFIIFLTCFNFIFMTTSMELHNWFLKYIPKVEMVKSPIKGRAKYFWEMSQNNSLHWTCNSCQKHTWGKILNKWFSFIINIIENITHMSPNIKNCVTNSNIIVQYTHKKMSISCLLFLGTCSHLFLIMKDTWSTCVWI
jgi:hypothetical protein